jgi:hypothetical protein
MERTRSVAPKSGLTPRESLIFAADSVSHAPLPKNLARRAQSARERRRRFDDELARGASRRRSGSRPREYIRSLPLWPTCVGDTSGMYAAAFDAPDETEPRGSFRGCPGDDGTSHARRWHSRQLASCVASALPRLAPRPVKNRAQVSDHVIRTCAQLVRDERRAGLILWPSAVLTIGFCTHGASERACRAPRHVRFMLVRRPCERSLHVLHSGPPRLPRCAGLARQPDKPFLLHAHSCVLATVCKEIVP